MRTVIAVITLAALVGTGALFFAAPFQARQPDLAAWVPAGPLLYLESPDFGALLRAWNSSAEKRAWLDSANYEVFAQSRLFGRLTQAWLEFTAAAGFQPDMDMLESIAGGHSALALYDIGKLEFLYISQAPSPPGLENRLEQSRAKYEAREAGGAAFYVRSDPASGRVVAFAIYRDYVVLATREELVAGALRLLAGESAPAVNQDPWFRESVRAASPAGDLRMVMNLESIIRTPYFRSYWIERNTSALKPSWAAVANIHLTSTRIQEDRVLLRRASDPGQGSAPPARAGELVRLVPDHAGLYRAWANPDVPMAADLIRDKLLAPEASRSRDSQYAPVVGSPADPGTTFDLETRIDEPPPAQTRPRFADAPLRSLLAGAGILSMLDVETSRRLADGVFIETPVAIVLLASTPWDAQAARAALAGAAENVEINASGNLLVLANSTDLLQDILRRVDRHPAPADAAYMAGFRHAAERPNFEKMMQALDYGRPQPTFFSGNIASLSRVFSRVATQTITVRDTGAALRQTVIYETPLPRPPL